MDVTIQISDPVLIGAEHFNVSYFVLPNGSPVDISPKTNAPFVISGLSAGSYQLNVSFVTADGVICSPVTQVFTVTADPPTDTCVCLSFSELYVQKNCDGTANMHVAFAGSGGGACGGYSLSYTGYNGTSPNTINYTSTALPPYVDIPLSNTIGTTPNVSLVIHCCNQSDLTCFNGSVTDVRQANCDCEVPIITDAWINYDDTTGNYKLCINFGSGGVNFPPYNVIYNQIGGTTINDSGAATETSYGYFEYSILPSAFTGQLQYDVIVLDGCGQDTISAKIRACKQNIKYNGGETYPTTTTVAISACNFVDITFTTTSVPSKMVVTIGGVVRLDTGYLGSTSYQTALNAALAGMLLPPETITQAVGSNAFSMVNPTLNTYAQVQIFSPLDNTNWKYAFSCSDCPPENTGVTLIVENTATSNVTTVTVHGDTGITASYISFNPYQPQGVTNTFNNVDGYLGAVNGGVFLMPIVTRPLVYKVEVFVNGTFISQATYSYAGTSQFHITAPTTGIVDGDEIRFRISST